MDRLKRFVLERSPISSYYVSKKVWPPLLRESIIGNNEFPQAFFAQGIRVGAAMANLVAENKISWEYILRNDPSQIFFDALEERKRIAHAANGFETRSSISDAPGGIKNIWGNDKDHAHAFLTSVAKAVYESSHARRFDGDVIGLLEAVYSDSSERITFLRLMSAATTTLSSPEIRALSSAHYKTPIREFMKKYTGKNFSQRTAAYELEKRQLHSDLSLVLEKVAESVKSAMADTTTGVLREKLEQTSTGRVFGLFGHLYVANIDPLRQPDY